MNKKISFCYNCGTEIPEGAKFCQGCGKEISDKIDLKYENKNNFNRKSDNSNNVIFGNNKSKYLDNNHIQILGIVIGIFIVLVAEIIFQNQSERIFLDIIGGLVTSFIVGGRVINGVLNGSIVGLFGGAIAVIYLGNYGTDILNIYGYILGYSISIMILCLVGGVIGVLIRKVVLKNN